MADGPRRAAAPPPDDVRASTALGPAVALRGRVDGAREGTGRLLRARA